MDATTLIGTLPASTGLQRDQLLYDAVRRREMPPITWSDVVVKFGPYTAIFKVSSDAIRVGNAADSLRITVNHRTAQWIANELGAVLPTPKLSDEIWAQAQIRIPPITRNNWVKDGTMASTAHMVDQSRAVDKLLAQEVIKKGHSGLIADVGKDWVQSARLFKPAAITAQCYKGPLRSANYGWHMGTPWQFSAVTSSGKWVLQPVGLCHSIEHTDYSQVVRLVRRDVLVCSPDMCGPDAPPGAHIPGQCCRTYDIDALVSDPKFTGLVTHEGPLPSMSHPGVKPPCDPNVQADQNPPSASCDWVPKTPPPPPGQKTTPANKIPSITPVYDIPQSPPVQVASSGYLPVVAGAMFAFAAYVWVTE